MPSRAYTVCKCGSWVFTDRIGEGKLEFCRSCGKRWPGITLQPRVDPGPQARIWKPAFRKPRGRVADQSPEGPVQRALHSLWDKMSPELKQELTAAGVKPSPPPGLTAVRGPKVNDEQAEAAKNLWESASEAQKKLLRQVGVMEPVVSAPTDLAALCKKHQEALPPSIQKALAELDPPAPTQTQQIENATKRFKQSTTELRQMIQQTASLQLKIDRAKAAYQELLEKMKVCQSELQSKQAEVTAMQSELESTIRADAGGLTDPKPDPFEGLLETLAKAGIALTQEQTALYEEARRGQPGGAQQEMEVEAKDQDGPLQVQDGPQAPNHPAAQKPSNQGEAGKPRSRSRGRVSQQG